MRKGKQYSTQYIENQREYLRKYSREHLPYKMSYQRLWRERHAVRLSKQRCQKNAELKLAVIELLGGVCERCSFNDPRALHIGHRIALCKQKEKKRICSLVLRMRLLKGIEPKSNYILLCANCNAIQMFEAGEFKPRTKYLQLS